MGDGTRAVRVTYDPTVASYGRLLGQFWRAVDPTRADGQFDTAGAAYRTAIWPTDRREVASALTSKQRLDELGLFGDRRVVTEVVALPFSGAKAYGFVEDSSQDFAKKNKAEYATLLEASGRNDWFAATYKGGNMFLLDGADPWPAGSFCSGGRLKIASAAAAACARAWDADHARVGHRRRAGAGRRGVALRGVGLARQVAQNPPRHAQQERQVARLPSQLAEPPQELDVLRRVLGEADARVHEHAPGRDARGRRGRHAVPSSAATPRRRRRATLSSGPPS
ncbi:peptide-methionine (S)-S-oxide reductase [Aureococcus anophagefferens]|nr:peptide-methionine (S)-S-oxide reductase [Aureococcus anophagefferens]